MNLDSILNQRNEILTVLRSADETFSKYKVDFDYIKHSKGRIDKIEQKYKFSLLQGILVVLGVTILNSIIQFIFTYNFFLPLLAIFLVFVSKKNTYKKHKEKEKILSEVARRFNNLKKKYEEFEYQNILHIKYVSPDVVQTLYSYIEEGRADSLKEAINLMHSENQNNQVLRKQEEILNGLNSASKKDTAIGVATIATILLSGAATRYSIRR